MTLLLIICRTLYPFNTSLSPNSIPTYEKDKFISRAKKTYAVFGCKKKPKNY